MAIDFYKTKTMTSPFAGILWGVHRMVYPDMIWYENLGWSLETFLNENR